MLVSLVLVFCMASSDTCTEARPVTEDLSPMACMVRGQQVAQEWLADHPGLAADPRALRGAVAARAGTRLNGRRGTADGQPRRTAEPVG
jgi:hypothetical protein